MPHGKLDVYLEGAVQIKDTSVLGKGSPYCTLTIGNQEFSSPPVAEGGTLPYFNTHFEFQIDRSTEQLEVKIFRKRSVTDDELVGYCIILFKEVFYHGHEVPVTPYALTRPSGRPGGHIRLSLSFKSQPRRAAPDGGYVPPRPVAGSHLQPRPVGSGQGAPHRQQPRPPPPQQQQPAQNFAPGPSAYPPPHHLPRRVNEFNSSSHSSSDDSESDGLNGPGPYIPAAGKYEHPSGRRPRPRPRPRPPGPNQPISRARGAAPSPPNNNNPLRNLGGAFFKNVGAVGRALVGSAVGALLNPDGDGSDWGDGGGDDGAYGHDETATFGSVPYDERDDENNDSGVQIELAEADEADERDDENNDSGMQFGFAEACEADEREVEFAEACEADEREVNGNEAGAPEFVGAYYAGPPEAPVAAARGRGRGRAGPPSRGRAGRAGRAGMRGRGGRGPPPVSRGTPLHIARGGPPAMARGGGPSVMARGGEPPIMRGRAVVPVERATV